MRHLNQSDVTRKRVSKWILNAHSISEENPTWTEKRLFIDIGDCTYPITNGQVFQCAHCGHYDPEWSAVEVLSFFKEHLGIEPYEREIVCSFPVAVKDA